MKIRAFLAPMAGFTDVSFRRLCTEMGCAGAVTEMISAAAVCHNDKKTLELAELAPDEAPCRIQLFGHDADEMSYALERLLEHVGGAARLDGIDINMGCPVRKIVTAGDGCSLMRNEGNAVRLVRAAREVTERHGLSLSVKIRAGWDSSSINAPHFAAAMADAGAQLITVHGRTREQMYAPSCDVAVIRAVREAVPHEIPVIGNGDICCAADAVRMTEQTGCDAVAIGRAALGNVWIFREIEALGSGEAFAAPDTVERISLAVRLAEELVKKKGETRGIREARGRAAHFIKGIRGSSAVRDALNRAATLEEFTGILDAFNGSIQISETEIYHDL